MLFTLERPLLPHQLLDDEIVTQIARACISEQPPPPPTSPIAPPTSPIASSVSPVFPAAGPSRSHRSGSITDPSDAEMQSGSELTSPDDDSDLEHLEGNPLVSTLTKEVSNSFKF